MGAYSTLCALDVARLPGESTKEAFSRCCPGDPPDVVLGRRGNLTGLLLWYEWEHGRDPLDLDDAAFWTDPDPLPGLLLELAGGGACAERGRGLLLRRD